MFPPPHLRRYALEGVKVSTTISNCTPIELTVSPLFVLEASVLYFQSSLVPTKQLPFDGSDFFGLPKT